MESAVILVFVVGYLCITLEDFIHVNKSAIALATGVICWTLYIVSGHHPVPEVEGHLLHHLSEIAGILFFLIGAMTIVELIDAHAGFRVITDVIKINDKRTLLWIIGILTFFLSAILDNLTTAIVMASIARKLFADWNDRKIIGGMIVIAANSGGAWSPMGDVTTTMLWVGNQITPTGVVKEVLFPSLVAFGVPMLIFTYMLKGKVSTDIFDNEEQQFAFKGTRRVFFLGIFCMLMVPVFKITTHLPPFMGMLLGLGLLWIYTEFLHRKDDDEIKTHLTVSHVLKMIDTPSILFFLGILLAVGCLGSMGILRELASMMNNTFGNMDVILIAVGFISSVLDNVPIVAALQNMYTLQEYPTGSHMWNFLAYTAGTGGSMLIIGSAAGVAIMGSMKLEFFWYLKKISLPALLGYLAGAGAYWVLGNI
jgi:Na+/H+ antiporter NhaD/arsenite permease-like protein